jgi:hypothetical protein
MSGRPLGGFLQNLMCNVGLLHDALAPFQIAPARLGQGEAAGGALDQPYPARFSSVATRRESVAMGIPEALLARVKLRARATSMNKAMSCSAITAGDRTTNGSPIFSLME